MGEADPAKTRRALVALILGAVGIAFAPVFVRYADAGPTATAFWRIFLTLPLVFLWCRLSVRGTAGPAFTIDPRARRLLLFAGLFFAADLALWHYAILYTTVANATLLANMMPVVVALFGFVFMGERYSRLFLLGLAGAIMGAFLLMGASFEAGGRRLTGDALGLATALGYAGYFLLVARVRGGVDTARVMWWSGLSASLGLGLIALALGETFLPQTAAGWLTVIGLALFSQMGGQTLIAFALKDLPAHFGGVTLLLQPVIAAALGWIIFAEAMGLPELAGAALILIGIFAARRGAGIT